jgi:hypothetical protein
VTVTGAVGSVSERPLWRTVALPTEHGGWGLTLEPVLLGLLVAPSPAGALLGLAAFLAFLVRTPLKLVVIDARRNRWLDRSRLALAVASGELAVLVGLGGAAVWAAGWSWLVPVAVAVPLVGVEFWFDVRSRGRRLIPELCGSVGIASVAGVLVLADGGSARLAAGMWLLLSARAAGSIPFVRTQIARLRRVRANLRSTDVMQALAVTVGVCAVVLDRRMAAGFAGLVVLAVLQVVWLRRPPIAAKVLGLRQMTLGVGLVAVTAAGVLAS